ncbi:MAG: LiaF-related protein [Chitinophagaceae bacterium]|nr:LiaF-related protein [Chitinophagaceae bacterium]
MEERTRNEITKRNKDGHIWAGVLLLVVGGGLLLRQLNPQLGIPDWLFSWKMLLIVIGLFIGFRQNFRDYGWLIMVGIGTFFLLNDIWPDLSVRRYFWPVAIITLGLFFILNAKRGRKYTLNQCFGSSAKQETYATFTAESTETGSREVLDIAAVFGGVKKVVFSKNFGGGEIVAVFGGAEIDMSQADFNGQVTLEIVTIFGGCNMVVPPDWEIKSEVAAILGGIEDKRPAQGSTNPNKVLVLTGTAIFGGIEIKSFR